jgi:hypothetical protein
MLFESLREFNRHEIHAKYVDRDFFDLNIKLAIKRSPKLSNLISW